MGTVFVKAACFILIIFLGYASKRLGLLRQEDLPVFSKLVIKITLPAAIVTNFSRISMDVSMLSIVAVGFLLSGFYMAVGYLLFWNGTREEKAFGLLNASGYNIGCFTMPFVQSFLGPVGVAVTSLFDAGNSMICTGISYTAASAVAGKGKKSGPAGMVLRLFSSIPFDCYILMTVLTLLNLRLPAVVLSFAETVGNANSFLSLMMIGLGINLHMSRKQVRSAAQDRRDAAPYFRGPVGRLLFLRPVFRGDPPCFGSSDVCAGGLTLRGLHVHDRRRCEPGKRRQLGLDPLRPL